MVLCAGFVSNGCLATDLPSETLEAGSVTNMTLLHQTNMNWAALPFALLLAGIMNTNKFAATNDGTLKVFLQPTAARGFYSVSFRVPGANTGTP
jgi:hypothetical protein